MSRAILISLSVLAVFPVLGPRVSAEESTPGASKQGPAKSWTPPWRLEAEHRYVWIRETQKVGETRFRLQRGTRDGKPVFQLTARRDYDFRNTSQRSRSSTTLRGDGTPLQFEERLEFSTLQKFRAHQATSIDFSREKARVKYVVNHKEESPVINEVELPPGTFLFASQAVEHWAVFASRIPVDAQEHKMDLFFPEFNKVFHVTFRRRGPETLSIQGKDLNTTRYSFHSGHGELTGSIWLDSSRRMAQIEFPSATPKALSLKVVLVVR